MLQKIADEIADIEPCNEARPERVATLVGGLAGMTWPPAKEISEALRHHHVRKERIVMEDDADVALVERHVHDGSAPHPDINADPPASPMQHVSLSLVSEDALCRPVCLVGDHVNVDGIPDATNGPVAHFA